MGRVERDVHENEKAWFVEFAYITGKGRNWE
jgi:hypothetical protein